MYIPKTCFLKCESLESHCNKNEKTSKTNKYPQGIVFSCVCVCVCVCDNLMNDPDLSATEKTSFFLLLMKTEALLLKKMYA